MSWLSRLFGSSYESPGKRGVVPILKAPPPPPPPSRRFTYPETIIDLGDAINVALAPLRDADLPDPHSSEEAARLKARWAGYSEEATAAVLAELDDLANGLCCGNVLHGRIDDIEAARVEHAQEFKLGERVAALVGTPIEGATLREFTGRIVARYDGDSNDLYRIRWDLDSTPDCARDDGMNLVNSDRMRRFDPPKMRD
jgi:hypothetical protein